MPQRTIGKRTPHEVSVRAETYDKLRAYCRQHGTQMRVVVDDLVNKALDQAGSR